MLQRPNDQLLMLVFFICVLILGTLLAADILNSCVGGHMCRYQNVKPTTQHVFFVASMSADTDSTRIVTGGQSPQLDGILSIMSRFVINVVLPQLY